MRSFSYVSTQMQLINCIEAIFHFNCDDNTLLIASPDEKNREGIQSLLEMLRPYVEFNNVSVLPGGVNKGWWGGLKKVYKQKRCLRKHVHNQLYDIVFSPNFKQAQQKFIIKMLEGINPTIQIVLVDDGLAVCEIATRRLNELRTKKSDTHYISRAYKLIYEADVKSFVPWHVSFFTVYQDINVSSNDSLIFNNYLFLKGHRFGVPEIGEGKVVVLGQPLVSSSNLGLSFFTSNAYCDYINKAVLSLGFTISDVVYFPHPVEDVSITLSSSNSSDYTVVRNRIPIELVLLQACREVPIVGFYTSALVNTVELDNNRKVYSIYFNEVNNSVIERIRVVVNNAYNYIESKGIPVLFRSVI